MNRQETLAHLKLVLRHDLNDNLSAFALRTILGYVIKAVRELEIQPEEVSFLRERNLTLATMQGIVTRDADEAVRSEYAAQGRKSAEKGMKAHDDYSRACASIAQTLGDFIVVMEESIA